MGGKFVASLALDGLDPCHGVEFMRGL